MTAVPADAITVSPGDGRSVVDLLRDVSASRLSTFAQLKVDTLHVADC
jgi:hypothetical protein